MFPFLPSKKSEDIEPHEILLDSLAKKREAELGISEKKLEVLLLRRILQGFFLFSFLLILALFARTFQFQVVEGKKFSQLSQENKYIWRQIQAERGVIYDKNLNQLVFNQPSFDLILDIRDLPPLENEREKVLKEISEIIKRDINELKKEIAESDSPQILVSENLNHQQLIILETKIKELAGFQIKNNPVR
jgi:penicillin-binding protein 2